MFSVGDVVRIIDEELECCYTLARVEKVLPIEQHYNVMIKFLTNWCANRWPMSYGFHPNQLELYIEPKPSWEV